MMNTYSRGLPLDNAFFPAYRKTALEKTEVITHVDIPVVPVVKGKSASSIFAAAV